MHLKDYIEKFKIIDKMEDNPEGKALYSVLLNNNETPSELALQLGYQLVDVMIHKPYGFFNDFDVFKKEIEKLIMKFGRFPSSKEIRSEIHIDYSYINKFGGVKEIKRKMGYCDQYDLIDSRGFFNSSVFEYTTAMFLIANNVPYLREQYPIDSKNYRSDFTFFIDDNNGEHITYHVEVWGYLKTNKTKMAQDYNKVRDKKELLYKEYGINYISIEPKIFITKTYDEIQKSLIEIFSPFLDGKIQQVEQEKIFHPSFLMSDDDLLNEAMRYSSDNKKLPHTINLRNNNGNLYREILRRFKNYTSFAETFNMQTEYKSNGFWSQAKIFEIYTHMLNNYNKILNRGEVGRMKHKDSVLDDFYGIAMNLNKYGGTPHLKLQFFNHCINNGLNIPYEEIKWLSKASVNLTRRGNKIVTPEQQELAKQILSRINQLA